MSERCLDTKPQEGETGKTRLLQSLPVKQMKGCGYWLTIERDLDSIAVSLSRKMDPVRPNESGGMPLASLDKKFA